MTAPHLPAGQAVAGKYTVRSLVAYTGATASYLATDAQGSQVVLKLLDPAIGQRADVMGALDRVAGETTALARSSVLPVLDAGYDVATGAPFRVSEYLNIPSLARLVDNGPLSDEVTASIIRGAALALDAAHARGLFHHALKPTNLFVGPAPHYPVLIGDFGSRVVQEALPTHEMYVQSAPWLAPEQLYPGAAVGAQADVYSLALLAFYALTGRSYWWACQSSPLDVQGWQQEMLATHVPASRRSAELGRPTLPAYDSLFARAMSTNPAERPGTAGEFAQAFSQASAASSAGQPAAAQPPPTQLMAQVGYPPAPPVGYPPAPAVSSQPAPLGATVAMPAGMVPGIMAGMDRSAAGAMSVGAMAPGAGVPPMVGPEAAMPAAGLPTFAQPAPRKKPAGMVPILIGIVGALIIGVVVLTVYFLRRQDDSGETATADTSSAPSSNSAGVGEAEPSSSGQPGSDGGSAAPGDAGPSNDQTVQVSFVCIPPCDKVVVDGEELPDPLKPIGLLPGKHTVEAFKGGYATRKESFDVELGGPVEKKFVMVPTNAAAPQPKKKCGKFLKRCD